MKPRLAWEPGPRVGSGYASRTLRDGTGKGRAIVVSVEGLGIVRAVHVPYVHADTLEDEPRKAMKFSTLREAQEWCEAMVTAEIAMFNN